MLVNILGLAHDTLRVIAIREMLQKILVKSYTFSSLNF